MIKINLGKLISLGWREKRPNQRSLIPFVIVLLISFSQTVIAATYILDIARLPFSVAKGTASCTQNYSPTYAGINGFTGSTWNANPDPVVWEGYLSWANRWGSQCQATICQPIYGCNYYPVIGNPAFQDVCPQSYAYYPDTKTCKKTIDVPDPDKPKPPICQDPTFGNPVSISSGVKHEQEIDYTSSILKFTRHYSSRPVEMGAHQLGVYGGKSTWAHNFNYQVIYNNSGGLSNAFVLTPDSLVVYQYNGNEWNADSDITDQLIELKDTSGLRIGWQRKVVSSGSTEIYDVSGNLASMSDRAGLTQTMAYSTASTPASIAPVSGLLISVTDAVGRSLYFTYDAFSRIVRLTTPNGSITYAYDVNGNMSTVNYPDNKFKTYLYENVTLKNSLTGIADENNNRYATWSYNSSGKTVSSEHAGAVEKYTANYDSPTSTILTDSRGAVRTYNFTTILGVVKSTGQSQPGGSGCAASAAALTYDVNGNIASRTDFKGNKTSYVYDLARNLETSRTEGLTSAGAATAATRTITSTWHPTWRLPLVMTEYNGGTTNLSNGSGTPTGNALRSTSNVYDTHGNLTSITEADPVRSTSRTTTITYTYSSAVPGLVLTKVIDGPRTDVSDISTYNYYPHDATCTPSTATPIIDPITNTSPVNLGCRGQLQSISNAINQTTSYDRYNHHGQVEQMTDANGLVTTSTYDLRQRLLTRTVGTETTSLVYDGVGQVTQLTLPDASQLNYSYDAAHRLTDVQDSLGNKVHYTLDTEGNRTNETTTDPANVLTKTLTRSYDALNRLQQVTGVE